MEKVRTYGEIQDYLLSVIDYADDEPSTINPSLTREQAWNIFMGNCIKKNDEDNAFDMLIKNVYREFPCGTKA